MGRRIRENPHSDAADQQPGGRINEALTNLVRLLARRTAEECLVPGNARENTEPADDR